MVWRRCWTWIERRIRWTAYPHRESLVGLVIGRRQVVLMYKTLFGVLGFPGALVFAYLFASGWQYFVLADPEAGAPAALLGSAECVFLGCLAVGIGLVVWPYVGVRIGARLDASLKRRGDPGPQL